MFSERYRPRKLKEVIGQEEIISKLLEFIKNFPRQRAAIIYGPTGCGKNTIINAIASELNCEIVEMNASSFRTRKEVFNIIRNAMQQKSFFARKKILLIDEAEAAEQQGIDALTKLIEKTEYPFVFIANDVWSKKLNKIRRECMLIEIKKLSSQNIEKILEKICQKEDIKADKNALLLIASLAEGDARAAINDLQTLAPCKKITEKDVLALSRREREINIFEALRIIFSGDAIRALSAFENADVEAGEAFLWLDENLPRACEKEKIFNAYMNISKADIFKRRITRQQHWHLLYYVNVLMTAGISCICRKKNLALTKPSRILKIWLAKKQNETKKSIAEKFARATHCSRKKAFFDIALLKFFFDEHIAKQLRLDEDESTYMQSQHNFL